MQWLILCLTTLLALVVWVFGSLIENVKVARRIGLPIIISPVSTLNPLWILTYRFFPAILWLRYLPFRLGTWARCTYIGWHFDDKHALHDELGPVFTIVTPAGNEVIVADSHVAHDVLSRRKDFIKPAVMYDQLNVFGPNVNTVEGEDWQRQRRLTAPKFNEKTSAAVWAEALGQAESMGQSWADQGRKGTTEVAPNTTTLALHVLTSVGFGESYPFHGGVHDLPTGHQMTYGEALSICLRNIITFSIFSKASLSKSWMPKRLQRVGLAAKEFQLHMEELLTREKARGGEDRNLMGALVHASEETLEDEHGGPKVQGIKLSDSEIYGNIFAFNLAGHETTANTIAVAIVLLAAYPQYQDWLVEELDMVSESSKGDLQDYHTLFPKLQRCLAIMYETLRLYGSIVFIPKSTGKEAHRVTTADGRQHLLPPDTAVNVNVQALHTDARTWGEDALIWQPSRWFKLSDHVHSGSGTSGQPFFHPAEGAYIPWADGPRACLGKKFSQVEFVAVIASLFINYRVSPAVPSADEEAGRQKCHEIVEDSAITFITLQMKKPGAMALKWERR